MKKQLHYLSLLILLSLCGCEVTLHDNYVETASARELIEKSK